MSYRPLPSYLTIQPSKIDGLGLFCLDDLAKNETLGVTHVTDAESKQLFRTPLGGFINHSEEPNAKIVEVQRIRYLYFLKDIKDKAEITVNYSMYDPTELS